MRMYLRDRLSRPGLIALLEEWAQEDFVRVQQPRDLAEQLSSWLSAVDAIKVSKALNAMELVSPGLVQRGPSVDAPAMDAVIQAAKAEVFGLITRPISPVKSLRGRVVQVPVGHVEAQPSTEPAAQIQRYVGLQKQMGTKFAILRGQMRQCLCEGSLALQQLAALDVVMEQMLDAREQRLWASLPGHLERRLANLRHRHQQGVQSSGRAGEPVDGHPEEGWLWVFEQDLQALLLAEMQVRLQPITGLLEAARNEVTGQQE
ncbi:DUF3348 family protein [Acidovorax sp. JHL-9]|uniref:DUF3348 family protein n=1 Tax=Acidovorax sp. JHL-9 TaxID=1276756 RepID=UPI000401F39B|nr:DUF3348 family protein [Acidovorax sp. JHL-9]